MPVAADFAVVGGGATLGIGLSGPGQSACFCNTPIVSGINEWGGDRAACREIDQTAAHA